MKLSDLDLTKNEYSEEELDCMIMCLEKSEEIKRDSTLFQILQKRMKKKVKSIKSLQDLRTISNESDLEKGSK